MYTITARIRKSTVMNVSCSNEKPTADSKNRNARK